jgi:GT2 family glycosyltransferase
LAIRLHRIDSPVEREFWVSQPHVVVIVLNWNGCTDTLACLASLARVEYSKMTVLVVDNGSTDGSEETIRREFPELSFLQTGSNLGFAGGNNEGLRWALERGADYALLLNNDTEVEPSFLGPMVALAQSDPKIGIVGSSIAYHHTPDRLWAFGGGRFDIATGWVRHIQRPVASDALRSEGHREFYLTGCTMLLRRGLLEEVGVLDESYFHFCEDVDLCLRAKAAGYSIAVAGDSRLTHKVSATTRVSSPLFLYYNLRSRLTLVRRHGPAGAPSRWAVMILWLRLWRPALFSGLGVAGWQALSAAWRDYLEQRTGPAPAEWSESGRRGSKSNSASEEGGS